MVRQLARLMNILAPVAGRALVATTLLATGAFFIVSGYAFARAGEGDGVGLIIVGILPLLVAPIYLWRGGRLGAEIRGDCLIVHHYFRDTVFRLERPLRVYRSVDATVIEAPGRRFVLDDCYFSDLAARDAVFEALVAHSSSGTAS